MTHKPELDPIGREYARLAFGIARHVPGYIDAWLGGDEERAGLEPTDTREPRALLQDATTLLDLIRSTDLGVTRRGYLTKQVTAMATTARQLSGDALPYREEVGLLFDIAPAAIPEVVFETAIEELDRLLPGEGSVAERMSAWKARYVVSPETATRVVDVILSELRDRTRRMIDLPENESIEISLVNDKPWSGYNWYLGGGRSRVELNCDLPIYAYGLTDLLAHEAYPGHHLEHALKERLYVERGLGEHALQLINTPECVISEGIATWAEAMVFTPDELVRFRREVVYPTAGTVGDPEREIAIEAAMRALRPVAGNAALLLHEVGRGEEEVVAYLRGYGLSTEAEARQRLRFIANPLWRSYIFTYHVGYDLLAAWFFAASLDERRDRFRMLLTEQVYPSQIAAAAAATAEP